MKKYLPIILLIIFSTRNVFASAPTYADNVDEPQAAGLIIKYKTDVSVSAQSGSQKAEPLTGDVVNAYSTITGYNLTYNRVASSGAHILDFDQPVGIEQAQAACDSLAIVEQIEYAEPNYILKPMLVPDDPQFAADQWSLNNTTSGINAESAWDISTGSNTVVIAVIDTGYTPHSDIDSTNFATEGYDFISSSTLAGDGNGRDSDARDEGDFCLTNIATSDDTSSWHGTEVMSIIGANSNNTSVMTGINWNAKMLPVRVLGRCGGTSADLGDAIRWSAGLPVTGVPTNSNPARIINMSLGANVACPEFIQDAIDDAHDAGAVLIAAAGNSSLDVSFTYPANCLKVVAVAAHDINGNLSVFNMTATSNFGGGIDLSAPGGGGTNIFVATYDGTTSYATGSGAGNTATTTVQGTSFSAPMVTGVASLILSVDSTLSNTYVEYLLRDTARTFPQGTTCTECGFGMLDASTALLSTQDFTAPVDVVQIGLDGSGAIKPSAVLILLLMLFAVLAVQWRRGHN